MAPKPTQKTDQHTLKPFEFHEFVQHFPHAALAKAGISRNAFVSVSVMLSRHCTFKTGEHIYPSVGTLADEAGVSKPTVRKVLAYLQRIGALEAVGTHRNPGGGTPVTEYRFRVSQTVREVLTVKDRNYRSGNLRTTETAPVENSEPLRVNLRTTEGQSQNHNRSHKENMNDSSEESSSPAPVVAEPSARSGAPNVGDEQEVPDWMDDLLSSVGSPVLDGL